MASLPKVNYIISEVIGIYKFSADLCKYNTTIMCNECIYVNYNDSIILGHLYYPLAKLLLFYCTGVPEG